MRSDIQQRIAVLGLWAKVAVWQMDETIHWKCIHFLDLHNPKIHDVYVFKIDKSLISFAPCFLN